MEGSQHNTMDVNYFGPNPQMGFWYMGALKAAEKMSIAMKDKSFAKKCRTLFEKEANGWTKICSTESTMNIRLQIRRHLNFLT